MEDRLKFYDDVVQKADIVKVIQSFIPVTNKSKSYIAVCPFHNDSHPSMNISYTKKIYKCFSCGHGGNVIKFVMSFLNISYHEAALKVCEICGIEVPQNFSSRKIVNVNQKYFDIADKVAKYYILQLNSKNGLEAKKYLELRGLEQETIKHFQIGYAPYDSQQIINILKSEATIEDIKKIGILSSSDSSFKDMLSNRIVFPITDENGNVIAFSGRIFSQEQAKYAKYMNTTESIIFDKSHTLYHFFDAKKACKDSKIIYIVEGFMDVIALYRAGISNAVALMGTALTYLHCKMIKKLGVDVRLLLDNDSAGQNATQSCIEKLEKEGILVSVVKPFENVKDCDEFLKSYGKDKLREEINITTNSLMFKLQLLIKQNRTSNKDLSEFIQNNKRNFHILSTLDKIQLLDELSRISNIQVEKLESAFVNNNSQNLKPQSNQEQSIIKFDKHSLDYRSVIEKNFKESISKEIEKLEKNYSQDKFKILTNYIKTLYKLVIYGFINFSVINELEERDIYVPSSFLNHIINIIHEYHFGLSGSNSNNDEATIDNIIYTELERIESIGVEERTLGEIDFSNQKTTLLSTINSIIEGSIVFNFSEDDFLRLKGDSNLLINEDDCQAEKERVDMIKKIKKISL